MTKLIWGLALTLLLLVARSAWIVVRELSKIEDVHP